MMYCQWSGVIANRSRQLQMTLRPALRSCQDSSRTSPQMHLSAYLRITARKSPAERTMLPQRFLRI